MLRLVFIYHLGAPVAYQSLLKKIQFVSSRYIRLVLVLFDPSAADSIEDDFPLLSKFFNLFLYIFM